MMPDLMKYAMGGFFINKNLFGKRIILSLCALIFELFGDFNFWKIGFNEIKSGTVINFSVFHNYLINLFLFFEPLRVGSNINASLVTLLLKGL